MYKVYSHSRKLSKNKRSKINICGKVYYMYINTKHMKRNRIWSLCWQTFRLYVDVQALMCFSCPCHICILHYAYNEVLHLYILTISIAFYERIGLEAKAASNIHYTRISSSYIFFYVEYLNWADILRCVGNIFSSRTLTYINM